MAGGKDSATQAVKSFAPWPKTNEAAGRLIRDILNEHSVLEIIIHPGEPVIYVYGEGGEGEEKSVDITPYDLVRLSEMEEIEGYDDEEESAEEITVKVLKSLSSQGMWPLCILVNDSDVFMKSVGFSRARRRVGPNVFLGYPIVQDSRVESGVVIVPATAGFHEGYGLIIYGEFAHIPEGGKE